ncbi:MAG: hypothetical protein SGARI_000274 [Bacillariaceae sp.]
MNQATTGSSQRNQQKESFWKRLAEAATPAAHAAYPTATETARNLEEYQDYGINLTEYALKYIGCSNIKTWSDEEAAEENGSVLKTDRFVVLRLCPRDECSNYNQYGCMEQFGDYLIPMEVYLQIMAETFFTQYQEYCETCYECMTGQQANNNNNQNQNGNQNYNNGNYNNGDDQYQYNNGNNNNNYNGNYNNNNGGNRRHLDESNAWYANNDDGNGNNWYNMNNYNWNNDDANNNNANDDANNANGNDDDAYNYNQYNCENYAVCENYKTACQDYTNLGFDLMDYFECAEFNIGNGAVGYMGPHCASDGKTIAMGVFSDQYCNDFTADLADMSAYVQVSGTELDAYTSDNCISCLASDGYTLEVDNNDDGQADVSDICGELYDEAAKCNKYMGNSGNYASDNQEKQENRVCGFIENLLSNSYDEYGEIYLQADESWMQYVPDVGNMPQWQKYTLSASLLVAVGLFAYACYLHRQLTQRKFVWYPRGRRGYSSGHPGEATAIGSRMHSGIIQGRSRSSGEFEMKNGGLLS